LLLDQGPCASRFDQPLSQGVTVPSHLASVNLTNTTNITKLWWQISKLHFCNSYKTFHFVSAVMADSIHLFGRDDSSIIAVPGPGTITTPSLTINLISRVLLAIIANLACIVPLKNLYRNGEFAAVVFIANIQWANLDTIINALIWRNDDTSEWWSGEGFCDLNPYYTNFTNALFGTCLLAIMRNLAQQVGLLRANPLTVHERRRRNLVQALIMFPLPLLQVAWVWPLTTQRYAVATLAGCSWVAWPSWPYMAFFVIAPVVVALVTSVYAGNVHFPL
jgi:pheromone a factor receptor